METSARRLKANKKNEGRPCLWCAKMLELGDDAAVCTGCEGDYHAVCWDQNRGCADPKCLNAPLRQLDPVAPVAAAPSWFEMTCPHCKKSIGTGADICPWCDQVTSPDGIYRGPKTDAPGAQASVVWGILGIIFFGIFVGIHAIKLATKAKELIRRDPRYGGEGWATAGYVLGIVDIVVFCLGLLAKAFK